jgi:hypothetical protein
MFEKLKAFLPNERQAGAQGAGIPTIQPARCGPSELAGSVGVKRLRSSHSGWWAWQ